MGHNLTMWTLSFLRKWEYKRFHSISISKLMSLTLLKKFQYELETASSNFKKWNLLILKNQLDGLTFNYKKRDLTDKF